MNQLNGIQDRVSSIVSNFCVEGEVASCEPFGSGHINETFYIKNRDNQGQDYLLQKINHHVFKDVAGLMENIRQVTNHLRGKIQNNGSSEVENEVLTLVPTKDKRFYFKDGDGSYWRMYHYLDLNSYDMLETEMQAYEGGKAFGKFQALLSDLDSSLLIETIPNFHQIEKRLERFNHAILQNVVGRVAEVKEEIAFVFERAEKMKEVVKLGRAGYLPVRIIHNDTKFNNVLLDKNNQAKCVIDLDTVMPGYVAYDFGDAIRTIINTAAEDEKDLKKVKLNIPLFKAYTRGYFEEAGSFLTEMEVHSLLLGVVLIPYEQIVRFLTDYIEGDTYYKIHYPEHNLIRTKSQIQLLKKIEEQYDKLKIILQQVATETKSSLVKAN